MAQEAKLIISAIDNATSILKEINKNTGDVVKSIGDNFNTIPSSKKSFESLKNSATEQFKGISTASEKTVADINQAFANLKTAGEEISNIGNKIIGAFSGSFNSVINFQDSMIRTTTLTGIQGQAFVEMEGKLKSTASSLAKEYGIRGTEVMQNFSKVLSEGAKAGSNEFKILSDSSLKLSKILGIDVNTSVDLLSSTSKAFYGNMEQSNHVMEVLYKASQQGGGSVQELGQSLSTVGKFAKASNMSLEDTVAVLTGFHKAGLSSSDAAMALRMSIANLSDSSSKSAIELTKMGVPIRDNNGAMRPFIDIIGDLKSKLDTLSPSQQDFIINELAGARASAGVKQFLSQNVEGLHEYSASYTTTKAATEAFIEIEKSSKVQLEKAQLAVEGLKKAFIEQLVPAIAPVIESVKKMVYGLTDFVKAHPTITATLSGIIVGVGGILAISGTFITALATWTSLAVGLPAAMKSLGIGLTSVSAAMKATTVASAVAQTAATTASASLLACNPIFLIVGAAATAFSIAYANDMWHMKTATVEAYTTIESQSDAFMKKVKDKADAIRAANKLIVENQDTVTDAMKRTAASIAEQVLAYNALNQNISNVMNNYKKLNPMYERAVEAQKLASEWNWYYQKSIKGVESAQQDLKIATEESQKALDALNKLTDTSSKTKKTYEDSLNKLGLPLDLFDKKTAAITEKQKIQKTTQEEVNTSLGQASIMHSDYDKAMSGSLGDINKFTEIMGDLGYSTDQIAGFMNTNNGYMKNYFGQIATAKANHDAYVIQTSNLAGAQKKNVDATDKAKDAQKKLNDAQKDMETFKKDYEQSLKDAKKLMDDFKTATNEASKANKENLYETLKGLKIPAKVFDDAIKGSHGKVEEFCKLIKAGGVSDQSLNNLFSKFNLYGTNIDKVIGKLQTLQKLQQSTSNGGTWSSASINTTTNNDVGPGYEEPLGPAYGEGYNPGNGTTIHSKNSKSVKTSSGINIIIQGNLYGGDSGLRQLTRELTPYISEESRRTARGR